MLPSQTVEAIKRGSVAGRIRAVRLAFLLAGVPAALPSVAQEDDRLDRDYSAELSRIPPLSPSEALESFVVASGFSIELAAAEPHVRVL